MTFRYKESMGSGSDFGAGTFRPFNFHQRQKLKNYIFISLIQFSNVSKKSKVSI